MAHFTHVSQADAASLLDSLDRLRQALQELVLMATDFQFEHDAAKREAVTVQTKNLLNAIRHGAP